MKSSVAPLIFVALLAAVAGGAERSWTSSNGKYTIKAELVDVEDDKVRLQKSDGTEITVSLDQLSEADQRYIKLRSRRKSTTKTEREPKADEDSPAESDDKPETTKSESSRRRGKAKQDDEVALAGEAQSVTMKLTRLELPRMPSRGDAISMFYRATRPQIFYLPIGRDGGATAAEFSRIIEKEPKYASPNPCRGTAHLGSQSYGFALDCSKGSAGYGRLYFDLNGNGDLTDDRYVDGESTSGDQAGNAIMYRFPRIDLTVDADGTKVDYSFLFTAIYQKSRNNEHVSASLYAAAYREADLRGVGKKKHHLVLVDYNSNGRFDDEFKVNDRGSGSVFPLPGDMLLVDPSPTATLDMDLTSGDNRYLVSKLVNLGGKFFELKVSPSGDKVELNPASVDIGYVSSQHPGFRAILHGDQGFLKIGGERTKGIPLPVGEWKLLSYTVDFGGSPMKGRGGATRVAARATSDCKSLEIVKEKTVDLPFGPPFRPQVRVTGRRGEEAQLGLSILGAGGEICTNLVVNGNRPESPEFVITTPKGEVVERGKFKYG
jgi:hypothetical protein